MGDKRGPGVLVGIVGPSGSGKDTLLRGARRRFVQDRSIVFPTRAITRPEGDENEMHLALSPEQFAKARSDGAFALDWDAHGLRYGIPASIDDDIAAGRTVVVNLSRGIIGYALERYAHVIIASVSVSADVLRQRLRSRGRETDAEIEQRLDHIAAQTPTGPAIVEIDNSASPENAIAHFCNLVSTAQPERCKHV